MQAPEKELEEGLIEIWKEATADVNSDLRAEYVLESNLLQWALNMYLSKNYHKYSDRLKCEYTALCINNHLMEALSSPRPAIREWAKVIAAEEYRR